MRASRKNIQDCPEQEGKSRSSRARRQDTPKNPFETMFEFESEGEPDVKSDEARAKG